MQPIDAKKKHFKPLSEAVQRHVVWHEGGGIPTVVHEKWNGAYRAACLLAEANPGERFHVMQSRAVIRRLAPASVDRSGEADETSTKIEGSAEGESAVDAVGGETPNA